ncbi:MAG: exosortase/archaeosortase family protein [Candidatus Aenigmatarchaeota archaeon]
MLKGKEEQLKEILLFSTKLLILSLLLYFVSGNVNFYSFQEFTAEKTLHFFQLVGTPIEREGIRLTAGGIDFPITPDCTAWKGMVFFLALLVSTSFDPRKVGKGLLVGIPVLYSLNLLRIAVLVFFTLWLGPGVYGVIHGALWQSTMILAVIALWLMWKKRAKFITQETN